MRSIDDLSPLQQEAIGELYMNIVDQADKLIRKVCDFYEIDEHSAYKGFIKMIEQCEDIFLDEVEYDIEFKRIKN